MGKKIGINFRKLEVKPENIYEGLVTAIGNGAHIVFKKRFIGKKVMVIVQ